MSSSSNFACLLGRSSKSSGSLSLSLSLNFPPHLISCSENATLRQACAADKLLCPPFSLHERDAFTLPCHRLCVQASSIARTRDLGPGDARLDAAHRQLSHFETFQSISCE